MYTEARKLHIIDEVLKLNSDAALAKLESVVEKLKETPKTSFKDFTGIWTEQEADEVELSIKNSCENINPDDWK